MPPADSLLGYNPGMEELSLALAVAFAAFGIWLTVRIVNRRERWAKRTALALACLPIVYVLSFGPACWIAAKPRVAGQNDEPRIGMRFYFPIGALIHYTRSENSKPLQRWITLGTKKGGRVIVPADAGGKNWYAFTAE
jgi:hypothetical protein